MGNKTSVLDSVARDGLSKETSEERQDETKQDPKAQQDFSMGGKQNKENQSPSPESLGWI